MILTTAGLACSYTLIMRSSPTSDPAVGANGSGVAVTTMTTGVDAGTGVEVTRRGRLGRRSGPQAKLAKASAINTVSYTHLRAHETVLDLVCRLLLEKKKRRESTKVTRYKKTNEQKTQIKKIRALSEITH